MEYIGSILIMVSAGVLAISAMGWIFDGGKGDHR